MTTVFSNIATLFFIIIIGYLAVHLKLFSHDGLKILGKYVLTLALPALIFQSIVKQGPAEILNFGYLGGYLIGSLSTLIIGYLSLRIIWKSSQITSTFVATGMACANSGFIGYPLLFIILPSVASTSLSLNMIVENLIIIPLILIMAEKATAPHLNALSLSKLILNRLATNPIILSMVMAILVTIFKVQLPLFLNNGINVISHSSVAVSLFVIGGTIAKISITSVNKNVIVVVIGKLFLLPAAVWAGLYIMEMIGYPIDNPDLHKAAIIMAATPAMSIYTVLALKYGQEDLAATSMLLMTRISFFSLSTLLYLI